MITIIHGDDTAASRNFLTILRSSANDPISLSGDNLDLTELTQILTSGGLFGESKFVSIESVLTGRKVSNLKEVLGIILENSEENNIVLWEGKEVSKANLNKVPGAVLKQFKLPQSLFQFMDSIRPNNTKQILNLYHETSKQVETELILFMLARQIRILMAVKSQSSIGELKSLSWQMSKLQQQARNFTLLQLKSIHNFLYEIDRQMKTGDSVHPTARLIDFLLVKI